MIGRHLEEKAIARNGEQEYVIPREIGVGKKPYTVEGKGGGPLLPRQERPARFFAIDDRLLGREEWMARADAMGCDMNSGSRKPFENRCQHRTKPIGGLGIVCDPGPNRLIDELKKMDMLPGRFLSTFATGR